MPKRKKKNNWFTRASLLSALNDPYSGAVMQASGFIREPETGEIVQGDFNGEGARALRKSLAEIASIPLIDFGVGLVGEAAMSVPAIRRAVTASRVARELNRGAKEMRSITESARRSASPLIKEVETLPVSSSDYSLTRTPSYSGSIPTKVSEMSRRFVDDVDEAVGWAMRRGRPAEPVFKYWGHELPLYQDAGAEMYVYPNVVSNHILKQPHAEAVLGEGIHPIENYSTPENAFEFGKEWLKRNNNRPYNLNVDLVGYTDNFVGGYSPVFRQKKVAIAKNNTIVAPESKLKNLAQRIGERSSKYSAYPDGFPEKFLDCPYVLPDGVVPANNIIYENDFQVLLKDPITGKELPMLETKDFRPDNVGAIGPDKKLMGIDLKRCGGLISRLQKHYGSNEKALEAVRKFAGGGYAPSQEIKDYIKSSEAFRSDWYKDGRGIDTVGYGFTGDKVKQLYPNGMTKAQADEYFEQVLKGFAAKLARYTPNFDRLTQNQRDALLSYLYNIGDGTYVNKSPKMQQALADFDLETVAANIDAGYNDKRNPGLRKRRDYEQDLFRSDIIPVVEAIESVSPYLYSPEIEHTVINVPFVDTSTEMWTPTLLADYAKGGKIHIKPENRGKFTALKKRTGHSASWFKAHGTPAQKKMATFALNARKWKHGDGGIIDRLYNHSGGDIGKMLELIQKARSV